MAMIVEFYCIFRDAVARRVRTPTHESTRTPAESPDCLARPTTLRTWKTPRKRRVAPVARAAGEGVHHPGPLGPRNQAISHGIDNQLDRPPRRAQPDVDPNRENPTSGNPR